MKKAKMFLLLNLVLYPIFCFVTAEINPFEWNAWLRAFYIFFFALNWYQLNKITQ